MTTCRERLPTEVAQTILCRTPDARALNSTVSSSAQFLRCFNGARDLIVKAVLYNEFGSQVLPDALAAQQSANLWPCSNETRKSFMEWYDRDPQSVPTDWSLHDSLKLSSLHDHVEYFVTAYTQSVCKQLHIETSDLRPRELDRMRCAFYRFETFCNLFGKRGRRLYFIPFEDERKAIFIDRFVPWETEQLACVYDFLFATVSAAFSDVGEHDIEMGEAQIPWRVNRYPENRCQEHYLSLGLSFLHTLDLTKDYEGRYEILCPIGNCDVEFLHQPLALPSNLEGFDRQLKDLSDSETKSFYSTLRDRDEDLGPFRAWKWAHGDAWVDNDFECPPEQSFYFEPECRDLRTKGYVFFDEDRVWEYFISHGPHEWRNPDAYLRDGEELPTLGMEESIEKRTEMWKKGWRGYWSEDDQSKMVWVDDWNKKMKDLDQKLEATRVDNRTSK